MDNGVLLGKYVAGIPCLPFGNEFSPVSFCPQHESVHWPHNFSILLDGLKSSQVRVGSPRSGKLKEVRILKIQNKSGYEPFPDLQWGSNSELGIPYKIQNPNILKLQFRMFGFHIALLKSKLLASLDRFKQNIKFVFCIKKV